MLFYLSCHHPLRQTSSLVHPYQPPILPPLPYYIRVVRQCYRSPLQPVPALFIPEAAQTPHSSTLLSTLISVACSLHISLSLNTHTSDLHVTTSTTIALYYSILAFQLMPTHTLSSLFDTLPHSHSSTAFSNFYPHLLLSAGYHYVGFPQFTTSSSSFTAVWSVLMSCCRSSSAAMTKTVSSTNVEPVCTWPSLTAPWSFAHASWTTTSKKTAKRQGNMI